MPAVFMESSRLAYRAVEVADAPILQRWINDPRVRTYLDHRVFPLNLTAEEDWIRHVTQVSAAPHEQVFVFGVKDLDAKGMAEAPIGTVGLIGIHWISREAELGILIGEVDQWHRGYAREASSRIVDYAFTDLNLNRVKLRVSDGNPRARRAYEAIGFVHEGTLRQAAYTNGKYEDIHVMAVLRRDWKI